MAEEDQDLVVTAVDDAHIQDHARDHLAVLVPDPVVNQQASHQAAHPVGLVLPLNLEVDQRVKTEQRNFSNMNTEVKWLHTIWFHITLRIDFHFKCYILTITAPIASFINNHSRSYGYGFILIM